MRVVFGDAPLARSLAAHLAEQGSVVLAGPRPVEGPWLWRKADPASGSGIRPLLEDARAVYVAPERGERVDGLLLVLSRASKLRGAIAWPLGEPAPGLVDGASSLALVKVGPVWGPEEPLVSAWAEQVAAGGRVWTADPGAVRPVAEDAAVATVIEASRREGARWTLAGEEAVRLDDLLDALAAGLARPARRRRVPLTWAAWGAGVPPERLRAWVDVPAVPPSCDGWHAPTRGRAAWLGDPSRWERAAAG